MAILEEVRTLPPDKQREVYEHAARPRAENTKPPPFKSVRGLWARSRHIAFRRRPLRKSARDVAGASSETIRNAGRRSRHSYDRSAQPKVPMEVGKDLRPLPGRPARPLP